MAAVSRSTYHSLVISSKRFAWLYFLVEFVLNTVEVTNLSNAQKLRNSDESNESYD